MLIDEVAWLGHSGFRIQAGARAIYIDPYRVPAGATDVIPEMDEVAGVDVALLPVSGTYVMTAGEAAEAARRIQPRVAVPMHWGEHLGTRDDALAFARQAPVEVAIMEKSDG